MRRILVRYRTKPEKTAENEALVKKVYDELSARAPDGFRYATMKLADGVTFVHISSLEAADGTNPLTTLDAFKAFQKDIAQRCDEPPQASDITLVGNYRLFGD